MSHEESASRVLITLEDAAARLSVSKRTLEREIARGRLSRPLKIGRSSRVELSSLLRYVESLRPPEVSPS